jgi:hypothetical protein
VSPFLKKATPEETEYILDYGENLLMEYGSSIVHQNEQINTLQYDKQIAELKNEIHLLKNQFENEIQIVRNNYYNNIMLEISKLNLEIYNMNQQLKSRINLK